MLSYPSVATTLQSGLFPFEERFHRALDDMRSGRPVILVDDFDRENEADMVVAAETISDPDYGSSYSRRQWHRMPVLDRRDPHSAATAADGFKQ